MRPKGSAQALEQRRRHAIRLLEQGLSPILLARRLGVSRPTVYRWRRLAQIPNGLIAKPRPRPLPRLSDDQLLELADLLRQGPRVYGWSGNFWTGQRVANLIERYFRVTMNPDHVLRFLRQRLGWTPRKFRESVRRPDYLVFPALTPLTPSRNTAS